MYLVRESRDLTLKEGQREPFNGIQQFRLDLSMLPLDPHQSVSSLTFAARSWPHSVCECATQHK